MQSEDIADFNGALGFNLNVFISPNHVQNKIFKTRTFETVTASKVSGNSTGISFNSAIDVDFNLYNNNTVKENNDIII